MHLKTERASLSMFSASTLDCAEENTDRLLYLEEKELVLCFQTKLIFLLFYEIFIVEFFRVSGQRKCHRIKNIALSSIAVGKF